MKNYRRQRKQKLLIQNLKRWGYATATSAVIIGIGMSGISTLVPKVVLAEAKKVDTTQSETLSQRVSQGLDTQLVTTQIESTEFPDDLAGRKQAIRRYLEGKGEDVDRWLKIIDNESGFDPNSAAPTQWHLCDRPVVVTLWGYKQPANRIIELKDYPNGVIWQARCEDYGAKNVRSGVSKGLTHIIESTWEDHNCTGERTNWMDNLDCSIKIRNNQGWSAWTRN